MFSTFENRLFLLALAFVLVLSILPFASAEEDEAESTPVIASGVDYACGQTMMEKGIVVIESYEAFLDDYFKSVIPSSEQVEHGMRYYRFVEDSLQSIYEKNVDVQANDTLEKSGAAITYCASIRDQYIDLAQMLLQKQAISSANSKRTFSVIDGLKAMNEDMEVYADEFHAVFPAFFNQFNNALPCYARQCITK